MSAIATLASKLENVEGTPATLGACWDSFQFIQQVAAAYTAAESDLFPAFVSAMAAASEGRDAVGFAPSMPSGAGYAAPPLRPTEVQPAAAADALAALATVLNAKLTGTAALPCSEQDRRALLSAAEAAAEIRAMLSGP
jgi:hypothetical protein